MSRITQSAVCYKQERSYAPYGKKKILNTNQIEFIIPRSVHCSHILRVQPKRCNVSQFIYFCKTLYMFQTGFPSIIGSSKLHIQRQVFARPLLLPSARLASFIAVRRSTCFRRFFRPSSRAQISTYSVRYLPDRYCYLLLLASLAAGSSSGLANT